MLESRTFISSLVRASCYNPHMAGQEKTEPQDTDSARTVTGAQTLMRGIDVLMAIGLAGEPPRFSDLSVNLGIPKGTLHRLLAGLQERNLVRFDRQSRRYHTGHGIFDLARHTLDRSEIRRAAKPEMSRLSKQLGHAVCLYVLDGEHVFVLDFEDPDAAQGRTIRVWPRLKAESSAPGLAVVAALEPAERERLLGEREGKLSSEIGLARALGYALHRSPDGRQSAASAAILNKFGEPVAALACQFDAFHGSAEDLHHAGRVVAEGARRASSNFGTTYAPNLICPAPDFQESDGLTNLETGRDFMGENPVWCAERQTLFWLDILAPALRSFCPANRKTERIVLPEITGGLALGKDGTLMLLGQRGLFSFAYPDGEPRLIISPENDRPDNRFNTATVDALGAIWAGTMAIDQSAGEGALYRISPDYEVQAITRNIGLAKNVAFAPDRSAFYIADGHSRVIFRYSCDPVSLRVGNRSVFVEDYPNVGVPNGITVDAEGYVWAAMMGGWRVNRYAPDGTLDRSIFLPVPMPTAVGFGGKDLSTLFITSTYLRLPPGFLSSAPLSGQLFSFDSDVPGQPTQTFQAAKP